MMQPTFGRWLTSAALMLLCTATAGAQRFTQTNLISNTGMGDTKKDPNLVNPWGLARSSGSPWWTSNNGTNTSTLYAGDGTPFPPANPLVVSVPGGPTGTVYNGTTGFPLNGKPSTFLWATEAGTILAWNGTTSATVVASKNNAIYKGLARATFRGANYLYATDFHNGRVDVLDANFNYVSLGRGEHNDDCPFCLEAATRAGFSPFGIQNIGGNLYVTYAKPDADRHDDVHGPGLGLVAVFTPGGRPLRVFEHGSWLNAPWGLAEAPGDFGPFSHTLLVGNFGSGQIAAYNEQTGGFLGLFQNATGDPLAIDGLWAISFGNNTQAGSALALYFTAGPNDESDGLFGYLTPVPSDLTEGNSK
jgi:uncharacterized protein (TIGR03118 family)